MSCRSIVVVLVILLGGGFAYGGGGPTIAVDPSADGFAALSVADIAASTSWYEKHFGLRKGFSYKADDGSVSIQVLSRAGLTIELQQHSAATEMPTPDGKVFLRHGIFKIGICVLDVRKAVKAIEAAGTKVLVPPFEDQQGRYLSAVIADNSGNMLHLFQKVRPKKESRRSAKR